MQFSEQWLRTLVDPPLDTPALAHALTMAGLEVETVRPVAGAFAGVVVARILEVAPHPNADRLRVCRVEVGTGEALQIVCGAPNAAAGLLVPCATLGAQLPGLTIGKVAMRGVESFGMLCSARELGISEDASGLLVLPAETPVGKDLRDALGLDDQILTIKLTPNRADCLGVRGIAREVAAITQTPWTPIAIAAAAVADEARQPVRLTDPLACARFAGRVIRGVNPRAPTPEWMKRRLERSGQRSISALVDVTNYVMLELNRPLHAYDYAKLQGEILVRWGDGTEQLELLNGQTVTVAQDMVAITDDSGPIGLGGVMGGASTACSDATTEVFLESAFFPPEAIAGRGRRLNLGSDAAHRFERGVDYAGAVEGLERATELVLALCGGSAGPIEDHQLGAPPRAPVLVRPARVNRILGLQLAPSAMADIFQRLGFALESVGDDFRVTPPSYRFDLNIEEDFIEEVARLHGFENIPAEPAQGAQRALPLAETERPPARLKRLLAARDYQEVITYAFVPDEWEHTLAGVAKPIALLNPIASQMNVMRSSLLGGLLDCLRQNLNRKQERVRIFEQGRCFLRQGEAFAQPQRLAVLAYGSEAPLQWGTPARRVDFYDLKGDLEALVWPRRLITVAAVHPALHPGRSAKVLVDGLEIGHLGELHPQWLQRYELPGAPIVAELDLEPLLALPAPGGTPPSRFPTVRRDLALVMDEAVPGEALLAALRKVRPDVVSELGLFDVYRGQGLPSGKKSLAILVLMQDTQKTMTDQDVDAVIEEMLGVAAKQFNAKLRTQD
ncbi:MAG: phenylalanine--tRNA ligase subunit beta [Betaproteobacteria bacterium]|nr:phenylalanine--tRNA ligase subunit beta [Betaproteobacteria bacterium]